MAIYRTDHFGIARKIVSNMTAQSWEEIPHVSTEYEADVTDLMAELKEINKKAKSKEEKITVNTVMMKVICEGIKAAPKMNTTLDFKRKLVRGSLHYHDQIDISMPLVLKDGEMMTVNMHNMGNKTLPEISAAVADTMRRADNSDMNQVMYDVSLSNTLQGLKDGKISQTIYRLLGSKLPGVHMVHSLSGAEKKAYYSIPVKDRLTTHDIEQGTTTISNFGSIYREQKGMCTLLEIIPPQTTAFAVNAVQDKPIVVKDENGEKHIEIRQILPITVAIDHRALDYGDCIPFFKKLDEIFKNPKILHSWMGNASSESAPTEKGNLHLVDNAD